MSLPTQINGFSSTIPRRSDNLKAFIYSKDYGATNAMQLFHALDDMQEVVFTGMAAVGELVAEFVEDRIVMVDTVYGSGLKVCEYALTGGAPLLAFSFGDGTTRAPVILRLRNGGIVIVGYRHNYSATLEIAYRNPTMPTVPGVTNPPQWAFGVYTLEPAPSGEAPIQMAVAEYPGTPSAPYFAVHFNRDGTHQIKRAIFRILDNAPALINYDGTWRSDATFNGIPRDGSMSPDMEFPFVASVTDWKNNRVLVSYAQSRMIYSETRCDLVLTRPVIVADNMPVSTEVNEIGVISEVIDRSTSPCPIFIDKAGNIYVLYDYVDSQTDPACQYHWKLWIQEPDKPPYVVPLVDAQSQFITSAFSHFIGCSGDGYCAAKGNDGIVDLFKLPMIEIPPSLCIKLIDSHPPQVKVSWDSTDPKWILQLSYSLNTSDWYDVPNQTNPMWVDAIADQCFFRLRS
jgi:hypothetical protein